jgi:hypothetical protein
MAIRPEDEQAFLQLAGDAQSTEVVTRELRRLGNTTHPAVRAQIGLEQRDKPLLDKIHALEQRLVEREEFDKYERQRESVRKMGFSEANVKKLEERMRAPGAPQFAEFNEEGQSAYQQAAIHFAHKDNPGEVSTFPTLDFAGPPQKREGWRELLAESDPAKNPLKMNRRARRKLSDKLWNQAVADLSPQYQK